MSEANKETIKEIIHSLSIGIYCFVMGFVLGSTTKCSEEKIQTPAPIQEVKIQTYDTLTNDNAHYSIITIDSIKFVFVKYGKEIDLERLK